MKIIILGGGRVGSALAEQLVKESHEITVVDSDPACLQPLQEKLDLRCVVGQAAYPEILRQAGAAEADSLVAVTGSDETNLLACQIAYTLFTTPQRIARVGAATYLDYQIPLFNRDAIPIDYLFTPGRWVADHLAQLVRHPGAHQLWYFAQGEAALLALKTTADQPWVDQSLAELEQQLAPGERQLVMLGRQQRLQRVEPSTRIEVGDELWFIVAQPHLQPLIKAWRGSESESVLPHRRIVIVGGGHVGATLARQLAPDHSVKLIERDPRRAAELAASLPQTLVFCSHAADQALLLEEHIEQVDLFIAVTNDDEDNILSALLARHLGAKQTLVLIQRPVYRDLIQWQGIDRLVTPQQITLSALLTHLRGPEIESLCSLQEGEIEVLEWRVPGEQSPSQEIEPPVKAFDFPEGVHLLAVVRDKAVWINDPLQSIQAGDRLIFLLFSKRAWRALEKQLQSFCR